MRLIDIINGQWAITPEMHGEVQAIYARHMRGDKINITQVEAATGQPMRGASNDYDVAGGVAVIPIDGVLAKKMNLFMQISGGTSTQIAANNFRDALADPDVSSIILAVDSPGGTVDGTQELADLIYNSRGIKPIISHVNGTIASAAYWVGSAADQVLISSDTDMVGSIGVVQSHVDMSGAEQQAGQKTTEITAGKYKRIASSYAPLTPEGRAVLQDQVNQTYSVFVAAVARNRGVTAETVLQNMADGRVFIGQQAIDAGLVDGVSTLDALIARLSSGEFETPAGSQQAHAEPQTQQAQSAGDAPQATSEETTMDVEKLKAEHPAVAEALVNEGKAMGAAAERERIQSVEAQSMPGHEALIANLKFDGKTSGSEAAVQVLAAEKAKKGDHLAKLQADAARATVTHAAAPQPGEEDDDDDDDDNDQNADDEAMGPNNPERDRAKRKGKVASMQDARDHAAAIQQYRADQKAKGINVSFAEAEARVFKAKK